MRSLKKKKYQCAKNEKEALVKVKECGSEIVKLNLLLRRAAYHNDLRTVKCALENGADPNSQNILGEGVWEAVCQKGGIKMVQLFLNRGASLGPDKFGKPPLIYAIENCREDIVRELINAGANVNEPENTALQTPLHLAATGLNSMQMVTALLAAGADPRLVDCSGDNPLARAKFFNEKFGDVNPSMFKVLQGALKKWKGRPLPKKLRRKKKSEQQKLADEFIHGEMDVSSKCSARTFLSTAKKVLLKKTVVVPRKKS